MKLIFYKFSLNLFTVKVITSTILLICFGLTNTIFAQSKFSKLSCPEKVWVVAHPFVAKKAFHITQDVQKIVDSIKQLKTIGVDNNGGKLDAFKHAYWMASLSSKIGKRKARKLGIAHEKGNFLQYKKHKLEDSIVPDSVSSEMDKKNNEVGISLLDNRKKTPPRIIQNEVLTALKDGKLYIIKKDEEGNFLTNDGKKIPLNEWVGKWGIPKYLVPSDEQ